MVMSVAHLYAHTQKVTHAHRQMRAGTDTYMYRYRQTYMYVHCLLAWWMSICFDAWTCMLYKSTSTSDDIIVTSHSTTSCYITLHHLTRPYAQFHSRHDMALCFITGSWWHHVTIMWRDCPQRFQSASAPDESKAPELLVSLIDHLGGRGVPLSTRPHMIDGCPFL